MIADEMGLGKTVQALAVACAYRREWPLLVVAPSSLKYPWIEELERWIPELQPGDICLVENKSDTISISSSKVTVLGYGLLTTDARALVEALTRRRFSVVVVDESHYLKSRKAARTKILLPLIQSAKRAVLLTGTPALGRPEELFMQIDALYPKSFGTWSDFAKKYCNAHYRFFGSRRQWDCRGASNLEELHRRLGQIMIRRLKADVLPQLPPKIRQRIPFDLPKEAAKEASDSFAQWERLMKGLGSGVVAVDNPFSEVMGLVTHMYKQTAVAKAGAVKDYIKMMLEVEQLKFLVFAHHLTMLQACTEAVLEAKAGYIRIDGSVPSSERIQLVHKFQSDPETRVAVLSIQAAGQGLTFTAASHVVFAELYWNPGHIKQAEDRAHRIGQTCSVNVHYLIAKGTFDGVMWSMLNRKESVTGSTLNGRKGYMQADEGDRDKWEFLSFANAWTPSADGDVTDAVFFTPLEKEKQHDIRSFFPNPDTDKKRKRTEEDSPDPVKRPRSSGSSLKPASLRRSVSTATPRRMTLPQESSWSCLSCTYSNSGLLPYCEVCERPRSADALLPDELTQSGVLSSSADDAPKGHGEDENEGEGEGRHGPQLKGKQALSGSDVGHPQDSTQDLKAEDDEGGAAGSVHQDLQFCASRYTDRIYLYTKDGAPLDLSFVPLDIKLNNWDELPETFIQQKDHQRQVLRFVQEWSSLAAMKQKLLRRSGFLFHSPTLGLQQLAAARRPHSSTSRFLSRDQVAQASLIKAQQEGGSVRLVTKDTGFSPRRRGSVAAAGAGGEEASGARRPSDGYLQAVDGQGVPLCLSCQQACPAAGGAWDAAFCSQRCQEDFRLRSSQACMRSRVLEAESGVCQHCGLQAHQLFLKVRDAPPGQRKALLDNTWLAQLSVKQLNEMIRAPVEGHFWQVDHIRPVYGGGGQCTLDNLQTLCTVCHRARTARQATERSRLRRSAAASEPAPDIRRFFIRK